MKYYLCDNVECVIGKSEAAIYCLNQNKIIRIKRNEGIRILNGQLSQIEIEQLLSHGIIQTTTTRDDALQDRDSLTGSNPPDQIQKAWLELTPVCNLKCLHCYVGETADNAVSMDWSSALNYLFRWHCKEYVLLGGEPFCSDDLFPVIEKIRCHDIDSPIIIITNGTLCSDSQLEWIRDKNCFVHFSLLGENAADHDRITQVDGSFDRLVLSMTQAHKIGIKASIICTLSDFKKKEQIRKRFRNRFPNFRISFHALRPQGRELCHNSSGEKCKEDVLATRISKKFFTDSHVDHPCLNKKIVFSYDGKVYPCIMARYVFKTFQTIESIPPERAFHDWWHLTKDQIDGCRDCALRYACFDCRGYASTLYGAPKLCSLADQLTQNS